MNNQNSPETWISAAAKVIEWERCEQERDRLKFLLGEAVRCVPIFAPEWRGTALYAECAAAASPNDKISNSGA